MILTPESSVLDLCCATSRASAIAMNSLTLSKMITGSVSSPLVALATILGIVLFVIYNVKRRRICELGSLIPGPRALPLFGNMFDSVGYTTKDPVEFLLKLFEEYPSIFRGWAGPRLVICINDPRYFKSVLQEHKQIKRCHLVHVLQSFSKNGLMSAPVDTWKSQRKLINPTFHPSMLKNYTQTFVGEAKIFAQILEKEAKAGKELDMLELMSLTTLDSICQTTMGVDLKAQSNGSPFRTALDRYSAIAADRLIKIWLYPNLFFYATQRGREHKKLADYLNNYTKQIIRAKKEERSKNSQLPTKVDDENHADVTSPKKSFVDMILDIASKESNFSDEQVLGEVNSMIATGNETTALASSYLMLALASHPDVQAKVYEELRGIYETDNERDVVWEDLTKMEYMERVIKETLRLFPVIPVVARDTMEEFEMDDYTIPKDATIIMPLFALHRNEEYWPNPLKFDPDRFLPEETAKRHPYAYLPFLTGPRNCIGDKYAMIFLKVVCATVLRKFVLRKDNITPLGEIRVKVEISMKPIDGIRLKLERRAHCCPTRAA